MMILTDDTPSPTHHTIDRIDRQFTFYGTYHDNFVNKVSSRGGAPCVWSWGHGRHDDDDDDDGPAPTNPLPRKPIASQIIHILCVWPILLTALVLLWRTPELPHPQLQAPAGLAVEGVGVKFNAAFYTAVLYSLFYMGLEVKNFSKLTGVGALAVRM